MAINLQTETLVSFCEARRHLPARPSPRKLRRWATQGILAPGTGARKVLESVKIGGERYTSLEAFERFCDQLNENTPRPQRG